MKLFTRKELYKILNNPKNRNKSYTYILYRNDLTPFYVGVGQKYRVFNHFRQHEFEKGTNRLKINTLHKEDLLGEVKIAIGIIHSDRLVCLELENRLVTRFGRIDLGTGVLTNLTDGGEIGPSGFVVSEVTKQLKSEIGLSKRNEFVEIGKAQWAGYSDEQRQQIVDNMAAGRQTEEYKARLSIIVKERWSDPEYRKMMQEKHRESWARRKAEKEALAGSNY